ncbi:MAG TPA: TlpA disulfide reductase family protein [Spirochaetota bacterium]|nr:TlpA disulfide reductase family protein [Spirochaetota bacterium]HOL57205.1 TlpA disulfide reductase family protein [Spirochaetota bacterium]HPP04842.1 TlpA disulfide reductase family protein [Spirochaetota bacterium]
MEKKNKFKFIDIIFYVVLGILIIFLLQGRIRNFILAKQLIGKEINFSSIKDINNEEYSLQTDKVVALVFWASWCNPCILEIPVLNDIYKNMNDKVLILAINFTEDTATINAAIKKSNILYPVVEDKEGFFSSFFKVRSIPTVVLIKNKKIVKIKYGYSPFLKDDIKKFFN